MVAIPSELEKARIAAARDDKAGAAAILKPILRQDPQNIEAWLLMAEVIEQREYAIQCLERVVRLDPNHTLAWRRLAILQAEDVGDPSPFQGATSPATHYGVEETVAVSAQAEAEQVAEVQGNLMPEDEVNIDRQAEAASLDIEPLQKKDRFTEPPTEPLPAGLPGWSAAADEPETLHDKPSPKGQAASAHPEIRRAHRSRQSPPPAARRREKALLFSVTALALLALIGFAWIAWSDPSLFSDLLGGQGRENPTDVLAVVQENVRAQNDEDLEAYIATFHSQSPGVVQAEENQRGSFAAYDLDYQLNGLSVIEQGQTEVRVAFVLEIHRVRGANFRDQRQTGEIILRKEGGDWKIYQQLVDQVEYLP